jgi:hypothetical protein
LPPYGPVSLSIRTGHAIVVIGHAIVMIGRPFVGIGRAIDEEQSCHR